MDKSLALCINEGNFTWDSDKILRKAKKSQNEETEKEKLNAEQKEKSEVLHSVNFSALKVRGFAVYFISI